MEEKMEWESAPEHHKSTWENLVFMITWSSVGIAAILLIMAATLTP